MLSFDIVIAGAGPAGTYLSQILAKKGFSVIILEKKKIPGKHACSGLISTRLKHFVPIKKEFLEHIVFGANFHSKNNSFLVEKKEPVAYVINRFLFDQYLIVQAKQKGAHIQLGEALFDFSVGNDSVIINNKYSAKILIGADGAASTVRRLSGLKGDISFVNGVLSIFEEASEKKVVDVFYGKSIAPGFFAWRIPRKNSVEYGLAAKKEQMAYFRRFLKADKRRLKSYYSHPIAFGKQDTAGERLILLGDAALQVKPFSGGGVIYSFICARIAAEAIDEAFKKNDFSKEFFEKNYDFIWKKKLMASIEHGKMLREALNSLDDDELDTFFEFIKSQKSAIEAFGDMDFL